MTQAERGDRKACRDENRLARPLARQFSALAPALAILTLIVTLPADSAAQRVVEFADDPAAGEPDLVLAEDARTPQAFLGLSWSGVGDAPADSGYARGARIAVVVGPAQAAGVQVGDLLVQIGDVVLAEEGDALITRARAIATELGIGAETKLVVIRNGQKIELDLTIGERPPRFDAYVSSAAFLAAPPEADERVDTLLRQAAMASGVSDECEDLRKRLAALHQRRDRFRLRDVARAHLYPHAVEGITTRVYQQAARSLLEAAAATLAPWHEFAKDDAASIELPPDLDGLLALAAARIVGAASLVERAMRNMSDADRLALVERAMQLTSRLEETIYIHEDENTSRETANRALIESVAGVDLVALLEAARMLEIFRDTKFLDALAAAGRAHANANERVVVQLETSVGKIVVCGTGDDTYSADDSIGVAMRIELGGNDRYRGLAARARLGSMPIAIAIDLAGDDFYSATQEAALAAAIGGVAYLIDGAGDDQYLARRMDLGAAIAGIAVLDDRAGNDIYRIEEIGQGVAFVGLGALDDRAGDDRYSGHHLAQGVGLGRGLGICLDHSGDDEYTCTGRRPSSYGTDGIFDGWGQGIGLGFRLTTSGGVGLLADRAGNDRYEGGNFSQGGGYFFGLGALVEESGNDLYLGSRYCHGFAAHQAIGVMIEMAGDDRYRSHHEVAHGLSWDETVVVLHDHGGNDRYEASGFSLSRAAHNGIAIVLDDEGDDIYLHGDGPAGTSGNDYHGGTSFAIFVDSGGGKDLYKGRAANDAYGARKEHGVFLDLQSPWWDGIDWQSLIGSNCYSEK